MSSSTYRSNFTINKRKGCWEMIISEDLESNDSSDGGTTSEEEDEDRLREIARLQEYPTEYWHIQKLIKYIKMGNQTACLISLCCLQDLDLHAEINQMAIEDVGGLETLVNILDTRDFNCKIACLQVLEILSENITYQRQLINLGAVLTLVANLVEPLRDLQILAARNLSNLAQIRRARRIIRTDKCISKIVGIFDVEDKYLYTHLKTLNTEEKKEVAFAIAVARLLWAISHSRKNRLILIKYGMIEAIEKMLPSVHLDIVTPAMGALSQCAGLQKFQLALKTKGLIKHIVTHLNRVRSPELTRLAAKAIYGCAEDADIRDLVRQYDGLVPLVKLVKDPEFLSDKKFITAITGAIWKCAANEKNIAKFIELRTVETMVGLLTDENEYVLTNVVGALSELVKNNECRAIFRVSGGIPLLIDLLNYIWPPLLENVPLVLEQCAWEPESMQIIEELDGVRLVWSLLKKDNIEIQANAAWALIPCVRNASDSGEMIREFVGGMELVINLLNSKENKVLAPICGLLAEIAKDYENCGILTDHGYIPMLADIIHTKDENVRANLARAIAYACAYGRNCKELGRLGVITPLIKYICDSDDVKIQRSAVLALYHLSKNPFNCITMHESGVVNFLLKTIHSEDTQLQNHSANCLTNIRRCVLEAENYYLIDKGFPKSEESSDDECREK